MSTCFLHQVGPPGMHEDHMAIINLKENEKDFEVWGTCDMILILLSLVEFCM